MRYIIPGLVVILLFCSGCTQKQQLKAKIFERKEISDKRLMIKYRYMVGSRTFVDSASVKNIVIGSDSINIIFDPQNPKASLPDFSQ